jgi:excisionase family DNA binding protein
MRAPVEPVLLTLPEAARYLALPLSTLRHKVYALRELPRVSLGRCVRLRRADLDAYIAAHTVPAHQGGAQ